MPLPDVSAGSTGHIAHHNTIHDWTQADELVRFVSRASYASDSNDGRTPFAPKATIQAAYDDLPDYPGNEDTPAGGTVLIGSGRHDVGSGLVLDRYKPCEFIGRNPRRWLSPPFYNTFTTAGSVITRAQGTYSAAEATPLHGSNRALVSFGTGTPTNIGSGFVYENLIFELLNPTTQPGMTAAIDNYSVNHTVIHNCMCFSKNVAGVFVYNENSTDNTLDSSWGRMTRNVCQGAALFRTPVIGNNCDNWNISDNVLFGGGSLTYEGIYMDGATRCVIRDNTLHWSHPTNFVINLTGCLSMRLSGNSGEDIPKYLRLGNGTRFTGCRQCIVMDPGKVQGQVLETTDVFVEINGTSSTQNLIIAPTGGGGYGYPAGATPVVFTGGALWYQNNVISLTDASVDDGRDVFILPHFKRHTGTPEGAVPGRIGDIYQQSDGGAGTSLWVKESGAADTNTGWVNASHVKRGSGTPEGSVVGSPGDLYQNTAGGAATSLYVKESGTGNTGWVAK